jgi:hypothetical protein
MLDIISAGIDVNSKEAHDGSVAPVAFILEAHL